VFTQTVTSPNAPDEHWRGAPHDFNALFLSRYEPLVRSLGAGFGNRTRAEDAVQEAFGRAYARWRRVRRLDDPAAWVRRVAVNLMVDERRRAERDARAMSRLRAVEPVTDGAPQDAYGTHRAIVSALEALPRQQRLALALFYLDDLRVQQVADAMVLSVGAVKYHLSQGRNALRAMDLERDAS
jgi:RNA polymerase sigma-70 factor (ECF subfamily)